LSRLFNDPESINTDNADYTIRNVHPGVRNDPFSLVEPVVDVVEVAVVVVV